MRSDTCELGSGPWCRLDPCEHEWSVYTEALTCVAWRGATGQAHIGAVQLGRHSCHGGSRRQDPSSDGCSAVEGWYVVAVITA